MCAFCNPATRDASSNDGLTAVAGRCAPPPPRAGARAAWPAGHGVRYRAAAAAGDGVGAPRAAVTAVPAPEQRGRSRSQSPAARRWAWRGAKPVPAAIAIGIGLAVHLLVRAAPQARRGGGRDGSRTDSSAPPRARFTAGRRAPPRRAPNATNPRLAHCDGRVGRPARPVARATLGKTCARRKLGRGNCCTRQQAASGVFTGALFCARPPAGVRALAPHFPTPPTGVLDAQAAPVSRGRRRERPRHAVALSDGIFCCSAWMVLAPK